MPIPEASRTLLGIEGWRGINHSFALVNQFQILELVKHEELALAHVDAPFHYPHWSASRNGAGFHPADEAAITSVPSLSGSRPADWVYRIFSPLDLRPAAAGARLVVFIVTELGLDEHSLVAGSDIADFQARGGLVVTPSQWSRERIIDFGFDPRFVQVVPHAASPNYFHPLPSDIVAQQRRALGVPDTDVLLLNIGAAIWNKGIDVLLKAFALARQQRKDLRLMFKDQRNTYGIAGDSFVHSTLGAAGLLSEDVLNAITLIPSNLTMDQMNSMYALADCYVSPYRAEGFNLPVMEAMTCGTPVVVTAGGATDDFVVPGPGCHRLESTLFTNATVQGKQISAYREPDLDQLVAVLLSLQRKPPPASGATGNVDAGWAQPVDQLLALFR